MEKTKISVIVTIHNAESYLRECLDSVIHQTFQEIEILCMDGGSTDGTPQILSEYAARDDRIRIINDTNTSYGHKVNTGIDAAKGKYIAVLESDDLYEPDMLERLYDIAETYDVDYANGEYRCFWDVAGVRYLVPHRMYWQQAYGCVLEQDDFLATTDLMDRFWTGIYRRDFLMVNQIRMNESQGAAYQDMSFRFLVSVLAQRVYHLDVQVYQYRMDNPYSSMKDASKMLRIVYEHEYLQKELEKREITDERIWALRYRWKYSDLYYNAMMLTGEQRDIFLEKYQQELQKDLPLMPNYSKERYPNTSREILDTPQQFARQLEQQREERMQYEVYREHLYTEAANAECIVIFGCGWQGKELAELLASVWDKVVCYADNDSAKQGMVLAGKRVVAPQQAAERYPQAWYVIANKRYREDIKRQLIDMGIADVRIVMRGRGGSNCLI